MTHWDLINKATKFEFSLFIVLVRHLLSSLAILYRGALAFGLKEENQESDVIISAVRRKLSRYYMERLAVY